MTYTRELARIKATQKAYEYRHHGRPFRTKIPEFSKWFLAGLRRYEAKGAEFELLPGMVKITWPGRTPMLRTIDDFHREWEELFPSVSGEFEEAAGVIA